MNLARSVDALRSGDQDLHARGEAMYAAVLLLQLSWLACAAGVGFALAVAWSRLALDRHAPRDLVAGAVAGALAGLAFWRLLPAVAG